MYRKIWAIPDIHGRLDLLEKAMIGLVGRMDLKEDLLVFLGDMIDRGPNSMGVVSMIAALREAYPNNVVALRGNHEDFLLSYYLKLTSTPSHAREDWYINGGIATERSYPGMRVSEEHVKFLGGLPYSHEAQGFFFSHAPVPREKLRGRYPGRYSKYELTWTYYGRESERKDALFDKHEGPIDRAGEGVTHMVGVCGHIHRGPSVKEVRIFPNYRMLDCGSGCWDDAPLAVHECISGETEYYQIINESILS